MTRHLRPLACWTAAVLGVAWSLLWIELRRTVPSGPAVRRP